MLVWVFWVAVLKGIFTGVMLKTPGISSAIWSTGAGAAGCPGNAAWASRGHPTQGGILRVSGTDTAFLCSLGAQSHPGPHSLPLEKISSRGMKTWTLSTSKLGLFFQARPLLSSPMPFPPLPTLVFLPSADPLPLSSPFP